MSDLKQLTDEEKEDLCMALYFWQRKGDPSRYVGWQRVIDRHPHILQAWSLHKSAVKAIDAAFTETLQGKIDER